MKKIAAFFKDVLGGTAESIISGLGETADRFIQTKEEKAEFELEIMKAKQQMYKLTMEAEKMYISDRQDARAMYKDDSSLQKIFAIVFLVGYIFLSAAMIVIVFGFFGVGVAVEMDAFKASIVSMVFTAMSTKINTITDFLFGGSKKQDESGEKIASTFAESQK